MQKTILGWAFVSADFSVQSSRGEDYDGSVTLIRDRLQKQRWHRLSNEEQETTPLYCYGSGKTLEEALEAAEAAVYKTPTIPQEAPC